MSVSVVGILDRWQEERPEFFVGGNEAGMILGKDVRGAEARCGGGTSSSRRAEGTCGFRRSSPSRWWPRGGEPELRAKAQWYLAHGVAVVWLVLPKTRDALVVTAGGESRHLPASACRRTRAARPRAARRALLPQLEPARIVSAPPGASL